MQPPVNSDDFEGEAYIELAGAHNFIEFQQGAGIVTQDRNLKWPAHLIIIGHIGESEFLVMDLSRSNGIDAPVFFMFHDDPLENLTPVADSFINLLEKIDQGENILALLPDL